MFQEMINGTVAVLTRPSVSTFEEHEKNNLQWALIYVGIAGIINAILSAIFAPIYASQAAGQLDQIRAQFEAQGLDQATIDQFMAQAQAQAAAGSNIVSSIIFGLIGTIIGFLIYVGVVYLLGRAFGGSGQFGELAYDLSLFWAPVSIGAVILNVIPFVGGILGFALGLYNIFLTYLAIQSGMNLERNKALYVMIILFTIAAVLGCIAALLFGALAAIGLGALNSQ
jgi:hypothetical protein